MSDNDIASDAAPTPAAEETVEQALDIGDVDPFDVADALRKNNEEPSLPVYGAVPRPSTSVTSSVSVVMGTVPGAGAETEPDDNGVGAGEGEDNDAVLVAAARANSNREAASASASDSDIPVFVQRQPLFSSNKIFGRGSPPIDDEPAQNHLLIRTADGNGLIIPQEFVLQTVSQSELRDLLGLPEQQQLQQRGVLLFDGSGNAFHLEV